MFTTTAPKSRVAATAFAASLLGTALIFAVPHAAQAATPDSRFVENVEGQLKTLAWSASNNTGVATVAVRINADGTVKSADIARSSGHAVLDRQALRTATSVRYPSGDRARNVAVVLSFGDVAKPSKAQSAALVARYVNAKGEALAAQTPAPNAG